MDQWLGINEVKIMAKMPEATIMDVLKKPQQKTSPKPKTFWSEFEKPVKRPVKIKNKPVFKSYFEIIKQERESEKNHEQREPIKIDWKKVKAERHNAWYRKYNLQPDPTNV